MAREWLTGGGGGVNYVQTSEPTYAEGETWLNPDTGVYYAAYDAGNGGDWHPIPPVQHLDEATAFDGSDGETVSHSSTETSGGSVSLIDGGDSDSFNKGARDGTMSSQTRAGIVFTPTVRIKEISGDAWSDSDWIWNIEDIRVETTSGSLIASDGSVSSTGGPFSLTGMDLSAGTSYRLVAYDSDGSMATGDASSLASDTSLATIDNGYENGSTDSTHHAIKNATFVEKGHKNGNALIYWGNPSDLKSWDLATFQRTLDNETVTIDVEDGNGNTLFSDISQNFDISTVSDSKEVRIRANLSRNDTSNSPTLDYCARRYTR